MWAPSFHLPSMRYLLAPITIFYDFALQPIPALAWLGAPLSALDVAGALRLAVVLRQQRELYREQHIAKMAAANQGTKAGGKSSGKAQRVAAIDPPEPRSRIRDFIATLVIAHGGEAIAGALDGFHSLLTRSNLTFLWSRSCFHPLVWSCAAPWLGLRPSFFLFSAGPTLNLCAQALVDRLPVVPSPSLFTELSLTITHSLFRMILLCNVIPRMVAGHVSPDIAASSYTLLLTAVVSAKPPFLTPPVADCKSRSCHMEGPSSPIFSLFCARRQLGLPLLRNYSLTGGLQRICGLHHSWSGCMQH
jgi:hypothetical protein